MDPSPHPFQPTLRQGKLTPDMEEAINTYLGSGGAEDIPEGASPLAEDFWQVNPLTLNQKLRFGEPLDATEQAVADLLMAAISSSRTSQAMTLYRGLLGPAADELASLASGHEFLDDGFISTSTSPALADEFASDDGLRLELAIPAGTPAAHIINAGPDFSELLLHPGSRFQVLSPPYFQAGVRVLQARWIN